MTRARSTAAVLGTAAVAGAAALAWGVLVERTRFTVRREVLPVLEPGARPLTVLHLSDLHMAPWQRAKQDFVRSLAVLGPDLVIETGDMMGHPEGLDGLRRAYAPFAGVPGVFVHGANDYRGPVPRNPLAYFGGPSTRSTGPVLDTAALDRYLTDDIGWRALDGAAHALELRGSALELFGTGDAHRGDERLDRLPGAIERMREEVEWDTPPLRIGVTHAPYRRVLDALVTEGADVVFAGHTHGGQVRIPGLPPLVTNCDIPCEQAHGLSVWRARRRAAYLQVSAGLGTSIYAPVRFACPPEAVLVELVPTA